MAKFALKSALVAVSSFVLLGISPAFAGDDAVRAEAYFQAITGGDAETIASFYADDAEFKWVGGPLAGTYKGKAKIRGLWEKFANAAGTFTHEVLELSESANGAISTVTARVMFKGENDVPVKFDMTYLGGKIATEIWQVDKASAASAKAEPNSGAKPAPSEVETAATVAVVEAPPAPEQAAEPKAQVSEATPEQATEPKAQVSEATPAQATEPKAQVSEATPPEPDYLPKGAAAPAPKARAAGSANARPEARTKTADGKRPSRKKRHYYEDDDYGRSGGNYDRYARDYDRYGRDYDYGRYGGGYGYRRYGSGYGYGGPYRGGFGLRLFGGFIGFGGSGGFGGYGRY